MPSPHASWPYDQGPPSRTTIFRRMQISWGLRLKGSNGWDGGADWAAFYSRIANSERPFCSVSRNLWRPSASQTSGGKPTATAATEV